MRGRDVVEFFCSIRPEGSRKRANEIAARLDLDLSRWIAFMSTGMRQKLALAVTFSLDTPLMILDEPTSNLDPTVRGEVLKLVSEARQQGRTILLSSHVLSEVEEICDRVWILRAGRLVHEQSLHELKKQHRIRARLNGPLPEIPAELKSKVSIQQIDGVLPAIGHKRDSSDWVYLETADDLSPVLGWLATCPLADVFAQPVSLRVIYDLYHQEEIDANSTHIPHQEHPSAVDANM